MADKTGTVHPCSLPSCSELSPRGVPGTARGLEGGEGNLDRGTHKGQGPSRFPGMGSTGLGSSPNIREHEWGPGVAKICSLKDFY